MSRVRVRVSPHQGEESQPRSSSERVWSMDERSHELSCIPVARVPAAAFAAGGSDPVILSDAFFPPADLIESMLRELPVLEGTVERSAAPAVLYHAHKKPLANVRAFRKRHTDVINNMTLHEFVSKLDATSASTAWLRSTAGSGNWCPTASWLYYSAPNGSAPIEYVRSRPQLAAILARMSSLANLAAAAYGGNAISAQQDGHASNIHSENFWLGGGGVTAFNHYDASWNAYAQLHGTKQFRLTPPRTAESQLRPHSYLHPYFRRTQLSPLESELHAPCVTDASVATPPSSEAPAPAAVRPSRELFEATLSAGDVLVLPPFIFHHVTADSALSVSLNSWAHDRAMLRVQRLVRSAGTRLGLLPHLHDWNASREVKAAVVEATSASLVSATLGMDSLERARGWLHERLASRWRPVSVRYPRAMQKLRHFCAPGESAAARAAMAASRTPSETSGAIRAAADALRELQPLGGDGLETANVVEQLALDVLEDVRTTGSFLANCFAS